MFSIQLGPHPSYTLFQALKMVQLFLSEPTWSDIVDDESVKHHTTLLNNLQSLVWSLLMSHGGRAEARLWLCNSISSISSVTPRHRREIFVKILRSKPLKKALAAQILQMVFEKLPRKAGSILAERSHLLESFFKGMLVLLHWHLSHFCVQSWPFFSSNSVPSIFNLVPLAQACSLYHPRLSFRTRLFVLFTHVHSELNNIYVVFPWFGMVWSLVFRV